MPIVLGGDHSLGAGSVAAAADWARRDEAAADRAAVGRRARRHEHAGDLAVAATCTACRSRRCSAPSRRSWRRSATVSPKVLPAHTVLVGVRNLDEREKVAVRDSRVHVFTMKDIDRQGIASIVEQAVNLAGNGTAGIHVSFDMDVCDPLIAPGVGTPVKGGLDYREAHMVMEIVADSGLLTSLDLVEVNPTLDVRNTTAQLGTELALSALGMKIL